MEIYNRQMIATIIEYLDLPISKKADKLCYYGNGKGFLVYDEFEPNREVIQIDLSIDVNVDYFGQIEIEVFSHLATTLILKQDNFHVRNMFNWKGYLQYNNFYIASLD